MKVDVNALRNYLIEKNLETPLKNYDDIKESDKISLIETNFKEIMEILGLDLSNDSLKDTPKRIAKMYVKEIFQGLDYKNFPEINVIENIGYDEMIIVKDIKVLSTCEHHFVTIDGIAKVAYIPKNKIIGLSKINRIVNFFSKRPQVQERLTMQIGEALKYILDIEDVAVSIKAKHYCVISRGIKDYNSETITNFLSGNFRTIQDVRDEFLNF